MHFCLVSWCEILDDTCWISCHDDVCRDVSGDHPSEGYDRVLANCRALENGALTPQPHIITDSDWATCDRCASIVPFRRVERMVVAIEDDGRTENAMITNTDSRPRHDSSSIEPSSSTHINARIWRIGDQDILFGVGPGIHVVTKLDTSRPLNNEPSPDQEVLAETDTTTVTETIPYDPDLAYRHRYAKFRLTRDMYHRDARQRNIRFEILPQYLHTIRCVCGALAA